MQSIEPSTCLVNTLCNEVCRIYGAAVEEFLVLERIVDLCIWHCTRIEPHVNEVQFACHHLTC